MPLGYSGPTALRREQCDMLPESQNIGLRIYSFAGRVSMVIAGQWIVPQAMVTMFQRQQIGRDGTDIERPFKEVLSLPSAVSLLKGKNLR
jgi:hypothetical protein